MSNHASAPVSARRFDLSRFSMRDMIECGRTLREMASTAASLTGAGDSLIEFLYEHLVDEGGQRAAVLARIFKTHRYDGLCPDLQAVARSALGEEHPADDLRCLVLVGTRGCQAAWNQAATSAGHRVIPLRSTEFIEHTPMIGRLVSQFGLRPEDVVSPDAHLMRETAQRQFNVFHVAEAAGSPYVPAQESFVIPHGVRSVLGFGGGFPSGNMFAVILFLRIRISVETADMFKPLALSVKAALLDFAEDGALGGA